MQMCVRNIYKNTQKLLAVSKGNSLFSFHNFLSLLLLVTKF